MSTKAVQVNTCFLFTYANWLLITCGFRYNIQYLFVYLFKVMSTKAGGTDHLFLFTYANHLFLHGFHLVVAIQSAHQHVFMGASLWLGICLFIKGERTAIWKSIVWKWVI